MPNAERPGLSFEQAVAAVQEMMDPSATVSHGEYLVDRHGHRRQFDVVIRANVGGHPILGVIECKDLNRRVGTPEVDAFVTKARDVNANLTLFASRRGFTQPAVEKATHYGIGVFSLLPDDTIDCGFRVGGQWFARLFKWSRFGAKIVQVKGQPSVGEFDFRDIVYMGAQARNWLLDHLRRNKENEERLGWYWVRLDFDPPKTFQIRSQDVSLRKLEFQAERICENKRRFVQFTGDAFVNWKDGKVMLPPNATVTTESWHADLSDWEDYEGEIPPPRGHWDFRMRVYAIPHPDGEIPPLGDVAGFGVDQ